MYVMMVYHLNGDSTKSQDNIVIKIIIFTIGPTIFTIGTKIQDNIVILLIFNICTTVTGRG